MSEDQHPSEDPEPTWLGSADLKSQSEASEPEASGTRLGDFELLRELGRGGMGVVYEARQVSLERRVALKVLPPGLGLTDNAVRRFTREARTAAQLHHTNIVPVYAIGEDNGSHFYVMELIHGEPLSRVLNDLRGQGTNPLMDAAVSHVSNAAPGKPEGARAREPAPASAPSGSAVLNSHSDPSSNSRRWFDTVANLLAEVADALHYAHGRGVIHRDVKPSNLMFSEDGRLCLTDFGLARVAQEPGMTVSGSFLGTPAFMSPEQIAAGRVAIDSRTDIYSLGAVLYETLTLQRPFTGESRDKILQAILTKDPRPPRRYNPRIPVDLETICQKAMEKDRDRRYQSAVEFASDLRQFLHRGLINARRAGIVRRSWKSARRHPVASAVVVGLLVVASVSIFAQRQYAGRSEEAARRLVASAELDLREGTYRQGLKKTERALAIAPEMHEARRARARLLFEANSNPRETVLLAREILRDNPDDWEAHGWLVFAGVIVRLGDIPVEQHLAALERHAPDTAEAWYVRGLSAPSNAERIRALDRVLELDPGHAMALPWRAQAKRQLHDTASAINDAMAAIIARPRSTRGRRFLAGIYTWDLRDYDRALDEYDRASAVDPEDPWVYKERSRVYQPLNLDDRERRIEELNRAVALAPYDTSVLAERARALNAASRPEAALADARRGVEIEPNYPPTWEPLLSALWRLDRRDELRATMEELYTLAASWPNRRSAALAYRILSPRYRLLGDHDEAAATAERAVELDPMAVDGHKQLVLARRSRAGDAAMVEDCNRVQALVLEEPGPLMKQAVLLRDGCRRPEAALAGLERAIDIAPQWADLYYERGLLHSGEADLAAAIADFDLAIERAPRWPDPHRMRGVTLTGQRRLDEALMSVSRAIELAPRHVNAVLSRADLYISFERFDEALVDLDRCFELLEGPGVQVDRARWPLANANQPNSDLVIRRRDAISLMLHPTDEALQQAEQAVRQSPQKARY